MSARPSWLRFAYVTRLSWVERLRINRHAPGGRGNNTQVVSARLPISGAQLWSVARPYHLRVTSIPTEVS